MGLVPVTLKLASLATWLIRHQLEKTKKQTKPAISTVTVQT